MQLETNHRTGLALAESLVRLKLTTSKVRTYAPPRDKRIVGWPGAFVR